MGFFRAGIALTALSWASFLVEAVDPLVAKGQYLFYAQNGSQFLMRGVAYQQGVGPHGSEAAAGAKRFVDPLADAASCKRDIPYLQQLGTNTIRVYAVDPTADHTACMQALDAAGIYVIADLSSPAQGESVERDKPAWTTTLHARYTGVIDSLVRHPNTLGFFAGNEVTNNNSNTAASAFVKAAVRDSKAYIASRKLNRWVGVGYATNDDADTRDNLAAYFNCGADQSAAVDFFGYNIYEWCGKSNFQTSGYEERTRAFENYSVPAFFSEYGCNVPDGSEGRIWQETSALYGSEMTKVWSGGIAYEYFQEQNDYGLVDVHGSSVTPRNNFAALAKAIQKSGYPQPEQQQVMGKYKAVNAPRSCPAVSNTWAAAETLPPKPDETQCACNYAALTCVPNSKVTPEKMESLFGTVCGLDKKACADIATDTATGRFGKFSACNATEQLAVAMDRYYANQGRKKDACDFKGMARLRSADEVQSLKAGCTATTVPVSPMDGGGTVGSGDAAESSSTVLPANGTLKILVTVVAGIGAMVLVLH